MNFYNTDVEFSMQFESIDESKGMIKGVKMVSEGEAKGHGVLLNKKFIQDAVNLGKEQTRGIKCRFGHPNMCSDALGTYLGTYKNIRLRKEELEEGYRYHAIGDLFLSESAKETPNGDLYNYVLALAKDSPDMFGSSIVFQGDSYEETKEDEEGNKVTKTFAKIEKLFATDLVDTPAATEGLFSINENDLANTVTEFLDTNPRVFELLSKKPDIIDQFLTKYNQYKQKTETMSLFKREKPLNKIAFGEIECVYQGDLKEKTQLTPVGCELPNGQYESGEKIYTIEDESIKSIEEKKPEMFSKEQVDLMLSDAVNPIAVQLESEKAEVVKLKAELEAKETELTGAKAKVEELSKLSSNHVPPKVELSTEFKPVEGSILAQKQREKHEQRIKESQK